MGLEPRVVSLDEEDNSELVDIADPICERAKSIDGVCESTIVELTRVAGLRSVVDAVAVCQLEYEQSVARTRVDYARAAEGPVARVEQHHVIHRKGTH